MMTFPAHQLTGPDFALDLRKYGLIVPMLVLLSFAIRAFATSRFPQAGFWAGVAASLSCLLTGIAGLLGNRKKPPARGKTPETDGVDPNGRSKSDTPG